MDESGRLSRGAVPVRAELFLVTVLAWFSFVVFTLSAGGMSLSWDALNHHIYLGWIADQSRFDKDFMPAGYQSLQFPYLYWPVYKLAVGGASAATAGVVLASLHLLAVPAVWMISRCLIPAATWDAVVMRGIAVALAFVSGAVLSLFDASSNDLLAAIPLVWAIALSLHAAAPGRAPRHSLLLVAISGLLAGASVGLKFSNGPVAILLPLLWLFVPAPTWTSRALSVTAGCAATLAGAVLVYGYWGWLLWQQFGNPVYPFADGLFVPIRAALGWTG